MSRSYLKKVPSRQSSSFISGVKLSRISILRILLALLAICPISVTTILRAAPSADAFGELPRVYDAAISPDGKEVASIVNFEGEYFIVVKNLKGEENETPRMIGLNKGVKPKTLSWANEDRVLASFWQSEKLGKTPFTASYIYSFGAREMTGKILVTPRKNVFRQSNDAIIDWLEDDPDHILMSFDPDTNNEKPDIRKVNVVTGRSTKVQNGRTNIYAWHTDTRGEPRVGEGKIDNSEGTDFMIIRDADADIWRKSDEYPGLTASTRIFGFTADDNELIIGSYNGRETQGLYVYDLMTKSVTRTLYHDDLYDAQSVLRSKDRKEIIGVRYLADTLKTELFEEYNSLLSRTIDRFEDYVVEYVDQTLAGDKLLFKISSPFDPGSIMISQEGTDELLTLGRQRPNLPSDELGIVISVRYTARDGQKIPAYVTLPPMITSTEQLKNLPFIILPHGGPYARDFKRFDYFAQFFATRGYGVLQMNFRGSYGFGKTFEEAGRSNWLVMQEDVEDGTRWLMEKGYADPERTCIAGWSFGGYAALMGAAKSGDLYRCAIAMAALTDIPDFVRDTKKYKYGKSAIKKFVTDSFADRSEMKDNSPVHAAQNITIPVFLAHGTLDQRVHFDQYKRMRAALKKHDIPTTSMTFKDEDHYLSRQENRQKFFNGVEKFLLEVNGKSEFMQ